MPRREFDCMSCRSIRHGYGVRDMSRSALLFVSLAITGAGTQFVAAQEKGSLRAPTEFAGIANPTERSAAFFKEAAKVLEHPRCQNCHPATRIPTQGEDLHPHVPFLLGGAGDHGVPGLPCSTCHTEQNV